MPSIEQFVSQYHSWMRSNCSYERRSSYIRSCRSWSRVIRGSRRVEGERGGAGWSVRQKSPSVSRQSSKPWSPFPGPMTSNGMKAS